MVGVTLISGFLESSGGEGYIDYMDRIEARENENDSSIYLEYLDRYTGSIGIAKIFDDTKKILDNKVTNLFDEKNYLTIREKERVKNIYEKNNNNLRWLDIYSFDNNYLKENGIIIDGKLNSDLLKSIVIKGHKKMLEKENIIGIWTGAIHYNTDNIHIHFSTLDLNNRVRGKRKLGSLNKSKSIIANEIGKEYLQEIYKNIDMIIKKDIIENFRNTSKVDIEKLVVNLKENLPKDKRNWNYKRLSKENKREANKISKIILEKYYPKQYKELVEKLDNQEIKLKTIYGSGKKQEYSNYKNNKIDDLYYRLGNVIIKKIKEDEKIILKGHQEQDVNQDQIPEKEQYIDYNEQYQKKINKEKYEKLLELLKVDSTIKIDRTTKIQLMDINDLNRPIRKNLKFVNYNRYEVKKENNKITSTNKILNKKTYKSENNIKKNNLEMKAIKKADIEYLNHLIYFSDNRLGDFKKYKLKENYKYSDFTNKIGANKIDKRLIERNKIDKRLDKRLIERNKKTINGNNEKYRNQKNNMININKLIYAIGNETEKFRNQIEYEKLLNKIERDI